MNCICIANNRIMYHEYSFNIDNKTTDLVILLLTERVGFEPTVPCGITGFQDQPLKPLGHLSKRRLASISSQISCVKLFSFIHTRIVLLFKFFNTIKYQLTFPQIANLPGWLFLYYYNRP